MNELIQMSKGVSAYQIVILIIAGNALFQMLSKLYKKITNYHDSKQHEQDILQLAQQNKQEIDDIKVMLAVEIKASKEYRKQSLADKIFRTHAFCVPRGWITRSELENFKRNCELYYELGGNGLVKDKFEPEVLGLRVVEDWQAYLEKGKENRKEGDPISVPCNHAQRKETT